MARRRPQLVDFLQRGLNENKYQNLKFENVSDLVFSIVLPHGGKMRSEEYEDILKDWYRLRNMEYRFGARDYTRGKQRLLASLRKSDYVKIISEHGSKITCKILNEEESREKRRLRRELRDRQAQSTDEAIPSDEPSNDLNEQVDLVHELLFPEENN
ncbi:unnamed protein product [Larinioides sclopetarius]|uniref:IRF tryptophan pentad repeat domain-containing protein n=1 Tax=Larinioides sclopetarius TaxID=280406 RepID=A0AAV2BQ89_9ARAC